MNVDATKRDTFARCRQCQNEVLTLREEKDPRTNTWRDEDTYNRCSYIHCGRTLCEDCVGFDYSKTVLDCSGWEDDRFCEEDCFKKWCADAGMNVQGQYLVDVQPASIQVLHHSQPPKCLHTE
jgi:hypothetical protein